ncbi:MYCBP-associated protein isoform X1 [Lepisosteus oculatus]|uniref:MYCBP-associated protein isoform X1 n=1 Tax=Lepisosteus oculatus TaxID=7918 RepID=UPI0037136D0A
MSSNSKSTGRPARKEARPRTPPEKKRLKASEEFTPISEEQPQSPTLKGEDIQALAIKVEELEKLRVPQPPRNSQKAPGVTRVLVRKSRPLVEQRRRAKVAVARPVPLDATVELLDYMGPGGPRFDAQGMVLPHSILGSLEDFKREVEARGDTELLKRVPDSLGPCPPAEAALTGGQQAGAPPAGRSSPPAPQTRALRHWEHHMAERHRQQGFISRLLKRPVQCLVMNQADGFRQTQEQRELISRALPSLHPGQGNRVGSEFWSLPQRIGDEMSGITMSLTQTERGNPQPVTHVGLSCQLRLETGNVVPADSVQHQRAWDQSRYLQERRQELRDVLQELDFNQPEIDGLEVTGKGHPFTSISAESCSQEEDRETWADEQENQDPLADYPDVMMEALLIPSLRFCGQPARWINSSSSHEGEVGVAARLTFEAVAGDQAVSHLELSNDGSTAVYYSWQHLPPPRSFSPAQPDRSSQHFYFNTSEGVILPGDTQRILFTFKSVRPGIFSETWALKTHPVLLGGAALQVTLRGIALHEDKTAEVRESLQRELEAREAETVARQILNELLQGVRTPDRPCSPVETYITEEERFCQHNPQLQYVHGAVQKLRHLWEQSVGAESLHAGGMENPKACQDWDLSIPHFRQALLSMPKGEEEEQQEAALSQLNSLVLELSQPQPHSQPDLLHLIGLQLWREAADELVCQATLLRQVLGMPERDTWGDLLQDEALESSRGGKGKKDDKADRKGMVSKEEKKGGSGKEKEEKKGPGKQAGKDKPVEDRPPSKKGKGRDDRKAGKPALGFGKEQVSSAESLDSVHPECQQEQVDPALQEKYLRQLHGQVYGLLAAMVESLFDLCEDVKKTKEQL